MRLKLIAHSMMLCWALNCLTPQADAATHSRFNAEPPFDACLLAAPLLMELGGVRVFQLEDGRRVVLSVASALVKDDSPADRLRLIKIGRTKAVANLLKEQRGVQIYSLTRQEDKTTIVIRDGEETGQSVTELLDIVQEEARGSVQNLPIVGTWYSSDNSLFYLAIGKVVQTASTETHTETQEITE